MPPRSTWYDELDLLDTAEAEAWADAERRPFASEVDRRQFVFLSLAAAAASTFGFGATAMAQPAGAQPPMQPPVPPAPLDNMEPVSWTFQPYPGGIGTLLEQTYREKGVGAFTRQPFAWGTAPATAFRIAPWGNTPFPTNDEDIAFLPVHRLAAAMHAGKLTSVRLTTIYLTRLKRLNPTLFCAVTILKERALAEAAARDAERKAGKVRGPLHGIPYGVKDLFAVKGTPTTWGAADFATRVIDDDADVVVRLREAGAVLIAKLSTGQFAQGGVWFGGSTKNPWNIGQSSSGSSAGPGSATAAGCVAFGIGTETSGSIVSPATTCGISALRPTFGRVSRHGGMVLAWSQDRVGPLTRTAEDAALVFNVIHGADAKDPGSITMPFHFNDRIDLKGLRIGVRKQTTADPTFDAFVQRLRELGATPQPLGDPPTIAGAEGGLGAESAAAFDHYVQVKAKELGMDMATVLSVYGRQGGGRGGAPGGGAPGGGAPGGGAAGGGAAATNSAATNPAAANPAAASAQLNRWVPGRTPTAMDFINSQRRRQMLITAWQQYLLHTDCYIGAADTGVHAQTGHPVVVVPIGFGQRPTGFGGRGGGGAAGAGSTTPAAPLNPQPLCAQIAGNLYLDDVILSVAHRYQASTDWLSKRPTFT